VVFFSCGAVFSAFFVVCCLSHLLKRISGTKIEIYDSIIAQRNHLMVHCIDLQTNFAARMFSNSKWIKQNKTKKHKNRKKSQQHQKQQKTKTVPLP